MIDWNELAEWDDDSEYQDKVRVINFRRARKERNKAREEKRNGSVSV